MDFEEITGDSKAFTEWRKKRDEALAREKEKFPDACAACSKQNRYFHVQEYYGTSTYPKVLEEHCDIVKAKKHILKYIEDVIKINYRCSQKDIFSEFLNSEYIWPKEIDQHSFCYSYDEWNFVFNANNIIINSQKELDEQMEKLFHDDYMDRYTESGGLTITEYEMMDGKEVLGEMFICFRTDIIWEDLRLTSIYTVDYGGTKDYVDIRGFEEYDQFKEDNEIE